MPVITMRPAGLSADQGQVSQRLLEPKRHKCVQKHDHQQAKAAGTSVKGSNDRKRVFDSPLARYQEATPRTGKSEEHSTRDTWGEKSSASGQSKSPSEGPPRSLHAAPRNRSYLKSQKYLEYRARPRRDTGKDGEPVWSDELEDAFQQALEANPPMGKRKWPEGGKL
ncbi:TEA/ATTS domain family-domain-containing protein [Aspergillus insuetus]